MALLDLTLPADYDAEQVRTAFEQALATFFFSGELGKLAETTSNATTLAKGEVPEELYFHKEDDGSVVLRIIIDGKAYNGTLTEVT